MAESRHLGSQQLDLRDASQTYMPDGRFDIVTRGVQRFRVRDFLEASPYLRAEVELLSEPPASPDDHALAGRVRDLLVPYLAGLGAPDELLVTLEVPLNTTDLWVVLKEGTTGGTVHWHQVEALENGTSTVP